MSDDASNRLISMPTAEWFTASHLVNGESQLLLAVRVPSAADLSSTTSSVNVEGPFRFARVFPNDPEKAQDVIEPVWAQRRDGATESNVHLHVGWARLNWCRVWYQSPLPEYHCRICFFETQPDDGQRGFETFWFYASMDHPLLHDLPSVDDKRFSKCVRVPRSDLLATVAATPGS